MNHDQVLELITTRETVAGAQAEQLRAQIPALTEQLVVVDAELADLATTRTTLLRLTGTTTAPPADASTDATVASPAYQQILAVFAAREIAVRISLSISSRPSKIGPLWMYSPTPANAQCYADGQVDAVRR